MLESLPATVELVNVDGSLSTEELEHLKVGDIVRYMNGNMTSLVWGIRFFKLLFFGYLNADGGTLFFGL